MKTKSAINRPTNMHDTSGFSGASTQKLRCTTAILGASLAGLLLAAPAMAGDHDDHDTVDHVLLVSVDGMHQSDLGWYVQTHPHSILAELMAHGIDDSNASTPFPSDSFPGMVGQVTGGNPSTTGIYYDDTWNHDLSGSAKGGYLADWATPGPVLRNALDFVDQSLGKMASALRQRGLYRTAIIVSAKHGQSPMNLAATQPDRRRQNYRRSQRGLEQRSSRREIIGSLRGR